MGAVSGATSEMERETSRSVSRIAALAVVFAIAPAWESIRLTALANTDIWWHLRTGLWILQNHAIPHAGVFSQYSSAQWVDSSWAFDAFLGLAYKAFGLRSFVLALMGFKLAFAVITYRLARRSGAAFWMAVLLSLIAQYVTPGLQPTSASVSVLFFAVELLLIVRAMRTGSVRTLYWLPLLFIIWANLDVQVVSGLALLVPFAATSLGEALLDRFQITTKRTRPPLPFQPVGIVSVMCALCTLVNPYTLRIFIEFGNTLYSSAGFRYFAEMKAIAFRRPQEFAFMLLVMAAYLAMGRGRRLGVFGFALMIASTLLGFRIQREAWIAVLASVVAISVGFSEEETAEGEVAFKPGIFVAALAGMILLISAIRIPSDSVLLSRIGQQFPVQACDYITRNHLPAPLFNTYSWGGFLMWDLPDYPVSIDSRVGLYGDQILGHYFDLIAGKVRLDSDPTFAAAQTILLERQSGMAKALARIPALSAEYRLVYSDEIAAVFVRQ